MNLDALIRVFIAAGLLPPSLLPPSLDSREAAPPLGSTHIEPAGTGSGISPAMIRRLRWVRPASASDTSAAASAAPLTAAEMAGPVPRDGGLQDLTAAELAGPVAREGGANLNGAGAPAGMLSAIKSYIPSLYDLGLTNPDGSVNVLGILGAALTGAANLGGDGRQAPPRIAPAWSPGGGSGPLGFVQMLPQRVPAVQPIALPAALRALGFGG